MTTMQNGLLYIVASESAVSVRSDVTLGHADKVLNPGELCVFLGDISKVPNSGSPWEGRWEDFNTIGDFCLMTRYGLVYRRARVSSFYRWFKGV